MLPTKHIRLWLASTKDFELIKMAAIKMGDFLDDTDKTSASSK